MPDAKSLQDALQNQRKAADELYAQVKTVLDSDSTRENETLKKKVEGLTNDIDSLKQKLVNLTGENTRLKSALHDQIYSERLTILQKAMDKKNIYFKNASNAEENKLNAIESDIEKKLNEMESSLKKYRAESFESLYKKLYALSGEVKSAVNAAEANAVKEAADLSVYSAAEFEKLKAEELPETVYDEIKSKSNLEIFIGGNLINKIGIILVIIGVIALSRFTFVRLPDTFKGIIMFLISALMLVAGEFFNRKKPNVFSIGLTGGGVACMFLSLAYSYFLLQIMSAYVAIFMCVLISALSFVLSKWYESQTIAAFALIGGYLPISAISNDMAMLYGALVYFIILNFFALSLSTLSKWIVPIFIGFFLNLFGSVYLVFRVVDSGFPLSTGAAVVYVFFSFAVYTVIPIIGSFKNNRGFSISDVVLMGLNTFFSSVIMYGVFAACSLGDYMGLLAVVFAVVYILLGLYMEKCGDTDRRITALFYLTSLAFVILIVPLQFGVKWLTLGWLAEAVLLAVYGIITEDLRLKKSGLVIYAFCVSAFLFFDTLLGGDMFFFKYMGVTLGSVLILAAFCYKNMFGRFISCFKIATLVNLWWYFLYLVARLAEYIGGFYEYAYINLDYLVIAVMITVTLLLSFAYPLIPRIKDKAVKYFSVVLSIISLIAFLFLNQTTRLITNGWYYYAQDYEIPFGVYIMAALVLILLCVLSIFSLRNTLIFFITSRKSTVELLPAALSLYFMFVLTQSLVVQYGLSVTNAAISVIFIIASVLWVVFGFIKRYAFMRRIGLAMSLLSVAKLFLVDLSFLTQGYKIISYFAFGLALLIISYIYQYFNKRLLKVSGEGGEDEA